MKQRTKKFMIVLILVILTSLIISACGPRETEVEIEAQKTGFAQTAEVQATMTAAAQPTATETPLPTATFTATPTVTTTRAVTATKSNATSPPTGGGADAAVWLANDPPDNTKIAPDAAFTVTWTIENTGTSSWTSNYYIEFFSGEKMGAVDKVFLPYPVSPGKNVQISVNFVAPASAGVKRSDWRLVNANDFSFFEFYVVIDVNASGASDPTATPEPTATS